tara:strand:- start:140298 stop:142535 length:2238 start_codon:yes stop_codon:yes gene_type:complete
MANSTHETGATAPHVALLSQVPFLSAASSEVLENLAENTLVRRYVANEPISQQEEFGHSMFILVSGRVSLHAVRSDGISIPLGTLTRPGEFFGEEALLGRGIRLATSVADTETILLEVEQRKFALLARKTSGASDALQHTYHQRSISTFIQMHPYLSQLPAQQATRLIAGATMANYQKDELPVRQGDAASHVMLIADGVLKALRATDDGRLSVLAYFNSGDVVGSHDPPQRPYNLTALGKAEVIFIPKAAFDELEFTAPQVYARFGKDRMSRTGIMENAGKTIFGSAEALFQEGMEVESLLIIDLDRCVRCGNCVRACHTRHEYTRLDRRGPIFRRRKSLESKEHEHLLIPSSCRHCRDPECMIGCPTGAIARHPNGEVEINENCVGCDNCARKCPYGNITMRPIPEAEQKDNIVKQAIKCNLCRGYKYSNCVHECPRGALLRVNPLEHFDELALVLAADQDREGQGSSSRRKVPKRSSRPMTTLVVSALLLLLCAAGITTAHLLAPESYSASTPLGLGFGIAAAACIVFALMLGARKKLSNHGLGRLESWTQLHMTFGGIGFVAALAHADYGVAGIGTTLLMLLFAVEVITGIAGQLLYTIVPKLLTHLEKAGNSKLIEDLYDERNELREGLREILIKQPAEVRAFAPRLRKLAGAPRRRYRRSFDGTEHRNALLANLPLQEHLLHHQAILERVLSDECKLADTVAQIRLHRVLKHWLFVHLATSAALVTVLILHIVTMLPIVW